MTESFTATAPRSLAKSIPERRRVLVTGAAGNIGKYFAEHSRRAIAMLGRSALTTISKVIGGNNA